MSADLRGSFTLGGGRGERWKEAVTVASRRAEDVSRPAVFHRGVNAGALKGMAVKVWNLRLGAVCPTSRPSFPP